MKKYSIKNNLAKMVVGSCIVFSMMSTESYAHKGTIVKTTDIIDGDSNIVKTLEVSEEVDILREEEDEYILKIDESNYTIPKENILKTLNIEDYYTVVEDGATLKVEPNLYAKTIKNLNVEDILYKIEEDGDWAKVSTVETLEGWVYLPNLKHSYDENKISSVGYTLVGAKYTNDAGEVLETRKGEAIKVLNFISGNYEVSDANGRSFRIPHSDLSLDKKNLIKIDTKKEEMTKSVDKLIKFAKEQIGKPYVWGATGYNSYDCSGLTQTAFKQIGVHIPRVSADQGNYGKKVSRSELQKGDMVFFNTDGSGISHVGLYIGNNEFIHAPATGKDVTTAKLDSKYFSHRFVVGRRVL